jgi:predicted negative regulator of RcsB-dependent stress response
MTSVDDDQIEQLRRLWDRYGRATVVVVVAVVVGILGGRFYGHHQSRQAQQAAALYTAYQQPAQGQTAGELAAQLRAEYPASSYATFATLEQAAKSVQAGDLEQAAEQLRWVVENAGQKTDRGLASLRLARVLLAQGKVGEAASALEHAAVGSSPARDELEGDIALAQGKPDQAREHYQQALTGLAGDAGAAALVNLKLDALGNRE